MYVYVYIHILISNSIKSKVGQLLLLSVFYDNTQSYLRVHKGLVPRIPLSNVFKCFFFVSFFV